MLMDHFETQTHTYIYMQIYVYAGIRELTCKGLVAEVTSTLVLRLVTMPSWSWIVLGGKDLERFAVSFTNDIVICIVFLVGRSLAKAVESFTWSGTLDQV